MVVCNRRLCAAVGAVGDMDTSGFANRPFPFDLPTDVLDDLVGLMNDSPNVDVAVFTEALELPVGQRASFLEQACGGDPELRQRVQLLLEAHDGLDDFLEQVPTKTSMEARIHPVSLVEKAGDHIGRFKLVRQIGEGGCGVVWLAELETPVRLQVALKIIKPGMDTRSVIARFEIERQTLALMDHPNIARIIDAGATDSGRPYFVMELIRGVKITEYCDQQSLTIEERLKLLAQVCRAVQHAHQKGVIHRDIKPSNILVSTTVEGIALPVVIDFGIAKATNKQRLADKTAFTAFEMLIGTPAYMSPEQAAFTSVDVDTRSDIYSLGVLLFELLTGTTPFDTGELSKSGIDEIRRVIREQPPVRPSTLLSRLTRDQLLSLAQNRKAASLQLIRAIHGDLDWIVMKALEKEPARRYQTAHGMALDLEHYLANEPILARPPSTFYNLQKSMVRNKLLFAAIGVFALLLLLSLVVVSATLANERRSLRQTEAATVKSQEITRFLEDMLQGVGPSVALGRDTTMMREILDRTAGSIGAEMTNQPAAESELRNIIGTLYRQIGNVAQAEAMHRAALAINRRQFGAKSAEAAESLNDLGLDLLMKGDQSAAEEVDGEALAIRRRVLGNDNADTATSLNDLSALYRDDGRLTEAATMAREALRIRQKLFTDESLPVADSLRNISIILGDEHKWAEAEATARQVLAIRRNLLGPEHQWVASALNDVAWAAGGNGKLAEAEQLEREALAMREKLLGAEHPDVAKSLYLVGDRMRQRGDLTGALPILKAALSLQIRLLGEDNPASLDTLDSLGWTLNAEGKSSEAEATFQQALGLRRNRAGNEDPTTLFELRNLGAVLDAESKWPEAESAHREELAGWRKRFGDQNSDSLFAMHRLAVTLEAEGKWAEAETLHLEAVAGWRKLAGNEDAHTLYALRDLGATFEGEGKFPEAEVAHREALAAWRKRAGNEDPDTLTTLGRLGFTLEREGKLSDAENVYREALALQRKRAGDEDEQTLTDWGNLARVLNTQQKFGETEQLLDKVLTPTFILQPASSDLLSIRAGLKARRGQWQEAAVDAGLALEYQPANPRYAMVTALFLKAHDLPAYERLCKRLMAAYASTSDPYDADQVAKSCLFLPATEVDLNIVGRLADVAVTKGSGDSGALPYYQDCKALAEYRLGHYAAAVEWAQKPLKISGIYVHGHTYATLAMAEWQLGHKEKAREMLVKGETLDPQVMPASIAQDPSNAWLAWLFARIQLDEATALIQPEATIAQSPR